MVNNQRLIKIAAVFAIAVILYTLRPMPEYALHARTAAGMYETSDINQEETLDALKRLTASVEAELISVQTILDMPNVPDEALAQLNYHLDEMGTLSKSMHRQLVGQFGKERITDMIKLPNWAIETIALTQVLSQNSIIPIKSLSKTRHRQMQGNLKWVETALGDLQEMLRQAMPLTGNTPVSPTREVVN